MSCNAKKDPNGTWRIQYRWTDWTGTKKKSQKCEFFMFFTLNDT